MAYQGETVKPAFDLDTPPNHVKLCQIIWQSMVDDGHERDGYRWAEPLSQAEWVERVGISPRTLRNLIKLPPIIAKTRGHGKAKVTYLRVGDPDPKAEQEAKQRHVANILSKTFRTHMSGRELSEVRAKYTKLALQDRSPRSRVRLVGRQRLELQEVGRKWKITPPKLYGYLNGLVENWPNGWEPAIFHYTLNHWHVFMDRVKIDLDQAWHMQEIGCKVTFDDAMEVEALHTAYKLRNVDLSQYRRAGKRVRQNGRTVRKDGLDGGYNWWVWRKPHLPFLLRFAHVAAQIYRENNVMEERQ